MRRSWLYFVPAALIVVTAGIARLVSDDGPAQSVAASAPTSSTLLAAPVVTTTTTVVEEAPHQPEAATPVPLDLAGVNRQDPRAVAAAWGCAYWAHPRGETAEALAQRLSPLATPEMTAAVAELRMPDFGSEVVEVYPGATERTNKPNTYSVGCRTLTAGPDGAPKAPPAAVLPEVTVAFDGRQWLVSGATVGGLVLP
jgi:hypothetical protein